MTSIPVRCATLSNRIASGRADSSMAATSVL
jgi:hypothetical protein